MLPFSPLYIRIVPIPVLYNCLKIFHILSATLLLMSMIYSYVIWQLSLKSNKNTAIAANSIQKTTFLLILPLAVIQLLTGFTMISIKSTDLTQLWVSGSITGFIIGVGAWFGFVYSLLLTNPTEKLHYSLLSVCVLGVLMMIFFMATRIATIYG
jgi:hypothetical protein